MYGTGRIGEIKSSLEKLHKASIKEISEAVKLSALCEVLQITADEFDDLISQNSPVSRTVKGHCFESYFDKVMAENGITCVEVGGDVEVDRIINGHKLQLKTPTLAGTNDEVIQYKTHKTHGAKSEKESFDYYHRLSDFADYLVGLVSYNPFEVLILSKDELPTLAKSPEHLQSPFTVNWKNNPARNAFGRIGITSTLNLVNTMSGDAQMLPKTSNLIGVDTDVILNTIINDANFRIWDMSIRGFSREFVFTRLALKNNISLVSPVGLRRERADKADHAVKTPTGYKFIQMKGVSTNNCDFSKSDPIIATETQLTRGRVNDHPSQSRLYLKSDFDYLVIALDPPIVDLCQTKIGLAGGMNWEFYLIPTSELDEHHVITHRLKSLQTFKYSDLQKYKVANWANIQF
jgi:hypothetical protein